LKHALLNELFNMSIQIAKSQKILSRIKYKIKYTKIMDNVSMTLQKRNRTNNSKNPLVFYPYYNHYTHPVIKERMYGEWAPLQWCNFEDAKISHFLQFPTDTSKPYFVEPNDQILTLAGFIGAKTPAECIKRIDEVKELINSDNFLGILIGDDGLQQQFIHYFGKELAHKIFKFEQMRCLPKISVQKFLETEKKFKKIVNFLFLASDYNIKAVNIVIEAWVSLNIKINVGKLTIVCPNVPKKILDSKKKIQSIQFINQAPLNQAQKNLLLKNNDVTIALTHIDGGSNAWEGIEYGHPIITNTYHRDKYLLKNKNGFSIKFKNEFYKPGEYGKKYNSIEEYLAIIDRDVKEGLYDSSVKELAQVILQYIDSPFLLREHSINSLRLAWDQSVWKSNYTLLNLYNKAIGS
jgi:hypothetical protein